MLNAFAWRCALAILLVFAALPLAAQPVGDTIEEVRKRGHVVCGVGESLAGFSSVDKDGRWTGLEVEFCAALAAAVLGDREAVKYRALTVDQRFTALKDGEIDVLARGTAWTLTRDTELGIRFVGTLYFDGLGFLVPRKQAVASVLELSGARICVPTGPTGAEELDAYFARKRMRLEAVASERWEDLVAAYLAGRCTALAGDVSALARARAGLEAASDHLLLPEVVRAWPLGVAVGIGDERWFAVVRWTLNALVGAEQLGIDQANAEMLRVSSKRLEIRRLLGSEGDPGAALGLAQDWALKMLTQVGNYGEIYARNLGDGSPLKLRRGLNALWSEGGLMQAPPFR
jgi:general L-amino acid transport system substrate-binding protein